MTIPNILTILRIVLVPFFIYCILQEESSYKMAAFLMFTAAALTDLVDGYIARRFNQESELGKFLDPLADKLLVVATLLVFILLEEQIQLWMVLIIIFRDMLVTAMRWLAIRKGSSLRTSNFGKAKTAFQMISIFLILLIFAVRKDGVHDRVNEYYEVRHDTPHIVIASDRLVWAFSGEEADEADVTGYVERFSYSVPYFLMLMTTVLTFLSGVRYVVTNYSLFTRPILGPKKTD